MPTNTKALLIPANRQNRRQNQTHTKPNPTPEPRAPTKPTKPAKPAKPSKSPILAHLSRSFCQIQAAIYKLSSYIYTK
ncbi:hypothetical protein [Helicobacter sp. 'CLO3_human']|uniref:hypothetical protein n=1 Tax=Helicobacter sp. 'CLO3_human' TaxID=2020249 RepID=UPI000CF0D9E6|nr:hypothetical protein [Helicobacter sp. 'CLO3_human']